MLDKVPVGEKAPDEINVIIEIQRGQHNKYEMGKETGVLTLDRVNVTALGYPADYGYVPETLCEDGDAIDALLVIDESVPHGVVVPCRPIGILYMVDSGEADEKLMVVAVNDVSKSHVKDVSDLGKNFQQVMEHYFQHYKDWKHDWKGESVSFNGWGGAAEARAEIVKTMKAYKDH